MAQRSLTTWISLGALVAVLLWAAVLAYLTYRVCGERGGALADTVYECALPNGEVYPWFQVLHPVTTLLSAITAGVAVVLAARWLWHRR